MPSEFDEFPRDAKLSGWWVVHGGTSRITGMHVNGDNEVLRVQVDGFRWFIPEVPDE